MGRPKKYDTMETVSVRLPKVMVDQIDAYVLHLKRDMPLLNIGRADGVRQLLSDALINKKAKGRKRSLNKP